MSMRARGFGVWALMALILCGAALFLKAPAIERDILARAQAAVKEANAAADVAVDGRYVIVRGPEADDVSKGRTLAAVDTVTGALGPHDGLWVSSANAAAASVGGTASIFLAEKDADGELRLTGSVASDTDRNAAEAAAKEAYGGAIDNQLGVAAGAQPLPDNLEGGLAALVALDRGALFAANGRYRLAGASNDPQKAEAASALGSSSGGKWEVFINGAAVAAPSQTPEVRAGRLTLTKTPDGALIASGDVASPEARAELLEAATGASGELRVVDRLAVRESGLPDGWNERALAGASALAALDWGAVSIDGARSYLNGMADSGEIGRISEELGASYTAELTPRPTAQAAGSVLSRNESGALAKANARIAELTAQLAARPDAPTAPAEAEAPATDNRPVETIAPAAPGPQDGPQEAPQAVAASCNAAGADLLRNASITFESKSAQMTSAGNAVLDRLVSAVRPCVGDPTLKLVVGGHTDSRGQPRDNARLSQDRADAVKAALIVRNVPPEAITSIGYGEAEPVADNDTEQGREANRRITIDWSAR